MSTGSSAIDGTHVQEAEQVGKIREFFMHFNRISEMCFSDCIWEFTGREVRSKELTCAQSCLDKFLKASDRISQRFQEHQLIANEAALAAAARTSSTG